MARRLQCFKCHFAFSVQESKLKTGCWCETEIRMYGKEIAHYWYRYAPCPSCQEDVHTGGLMCDFRGRTSVIEFEPPGRNYEPSSGGDCVLI